MNCAEAREWLQRRLDGDRPGDPAGLDQHLAVCPDCRKLYAAGQRLQDALSARERLAAPADLTHRIVDRVLAERRARWGYRRRLRLAVAAAACLLVAILLGYLKPWQKASQVQVPEPLVAGRQQPSQSAGAIAARDQPAPTSAVDLDQTLQDAGSALVSLTRRTADETIGPTRILLPEVAASQPGPPPNLWRETLEPPALSLRQAGEGVSTGFEPVTSSARRAVNMFLQDISQDISREQ